VNESEGAGVTVVAIQAETTSANEKVIYQYRLLKRVRRHPLISLVYVGFLFLWLLIGSLWQGASAVLFWGLGALAGWHLLYYAVTFALLGREGEDSGYDRRYGWLYGWPWFGYLPTSSVPFRQYRAVQLHLLAIGILTTAALAEWVSPASALTVGFVHFWWMGPRLFLAVAMKRSARPGSIISLNADDVGLYSP